MKFHIRLVPRFRFELTPAQLTMLTKASEMHYDASCRGLSLRPTPGASASTGLLLGWRNAHDWAATSGDPAILEASWRDLDLCLKCMEWPLPDGEHEADRRQVSSAFFQMMTAWTTFALNADMLVGETK